MKKIFLFILLLFIIFGLLTLAYMLGRGSSDKLITIKKTEEKDKPLEVYRFFRDEMKAEFIQFIPIVERVTEDTLEVANHGWGKRPDKARPLYIQEGNFVTERSVNPEQFGNFYIKIFEEWARKDVGRIYIQMFDVTLGSYLGQYSLCIHSPQCGSALAIEHNGDMYSCDHFVNHDHHLGNLTETHLSDLLNSKRQIDFGNNKKQTLPDYCKNCNVLDMCNGGCPKNRIILSPSGQPGLNYLCPGYKLFFEHIKPFTEAISAARRSKPF